MEDAATLAAKIAEAIQVLQAPGTAPDVRRSANEFVLSVREHPAGVGAALQLVAPQAPPSARFFGFLSLVRAAEAGRLRPEDGQVGQMRGVLLDMAAQSTLSATGDLQEVPAFVREKYAQALAAVSVHASEWPDGWPELQPKLFAAGQLSRAHAALVLTFVRSVCEALQSDAAARLHVKRRKRLSAHLKELCAEIFKFLSLAVMSLFQGFPELDRAGVLLIQELAAVVPVRTFLAADVDAFLRHKLGQVSLRGDVVQAFNEMLAKDVAQDLKEAPERMGQLLVTVCDLVGDCQADESLGADEYDVHKSLAMLIRDFVECNKPSVERRPELQALMHKTALRLLRYPSICVQLEAASIVPHVLRAALPEPKKGNSKAQPPPQAPAPPEWLQVKEELMPLLFLSAFKALPSAFAFFPLSKGYAHAMATTRELDSEEDLPGIQVAIRARMREAMAAAAASPAAMLSALQFLQELLPQVLAAPGGADALLSFEAAFTLAECVVMNVKPGAGPQVLEACRSLLAGLLRIELQQPETEGRRLELLGRAGGALEACAGAAPGPAGQDVAVPLFSHLFRVVEAGSPELRKKALHSCIAVCKAAPQAIRPVLQPVVEKAAALLQTVADEQHSLCEAVIAASTAAQNFEQQKGLAEQLLGPLVAQWGPLAEALAAPERLAGSLLGDRAELHAAHRLLLCFAACFRASAPPARPDLVAAGGFAGNPLQLAGVTVRNPVAATAAAVLPGLAAVFRAFHAAFPSDAAQQPIGLDHATASRLQTYIQVLDKEEMRALTSSLDKKRQDEDPEADDWDKKFPPPPGEDAGRVLQGRQLLHGVRTALYKCLGAALGVQDGVLTHPDLPTLLGTTFMESIGRSHPYHVELQLRDVWLVPFHPSGLDSSSEPLRASFALATLPKLLAAVRGALQGLWQRFLAPDGQAAAGGHADLLWAACTGTVMASRTYVDLVSSLVSHGGTPPSAPGAAAGKEAAAEQPMDKTGPKKKGKNRAGGAAAAADGANGASKPSAGWAGVIFTSAEIAEAVKDSLGFAVRWQDPKAMGHALSVAQMVAVRLMTGGETHQALRDAHAGAAEAPQRSLAAVRAVLGPLVALCRAPPAAPPGDGALHTVVGKPFHDFFAPERSAGQVQPSPFAMGVANALWPILSGMCQIFAQVCKKSQVKLEVQQIVHFPALVEACQLFATLRHASQEAVHNMIATMLDEGADAKMKRAALRNLVCKAVDPETALGEAVV